MLSEKKPSWGFDQERTWVDVISVVVAWRVVGGRCWTM